MSAGERVYYAQGVHFVPEELYPHGIVRSAQVHVHRVSVHAETAALEISLRAVVKGVHQLIQQTREAALLPALYGDGLRVEIVRIANAVEAGDAGDDNDVASAAEQGRSGAEAQFLNLVVDAEVLLYVSVRGGDVGLRLVVVVVGYEVFYGIVGEEGLELAIQLRRERLVVAQDERRTLQVGNDVCHGEGLSGAGDTEQSDITNALVQSVGELCDGLRLVSRRLV